MLIVSRAMRPDSISNDSEIGGFVRSAPIIAITLLSSIVVSSPSFLVQHARILASSRI